MIKPNCRERLYTLLQRSDATHSFSSAGHGFKEAVKYLLPKLLLGPIYHCLHYFDVIKVHIPSLSLSPFPPPRLRCPPIHPPHLLLGSIYHCVHYFDVIKVHIVPLSPCLSLSLPPTSLAIPCPPPYSSAHIPRSTLFDVITVQI